MAQAFNCVNCKKNSQRALPNRLILKDILNTPMNTIMSISFIFGVSATTDNRAQTVKPIGFVCAQPLYEIA